MRLSPLLLQPPRYHRALLSSFSSCWRRPSSCVTCFTLIFSALSSLLMWSFCCTRTSSSEALASHSLFTCCISSLSRCKTALSSSILLRISFSDALAFVLPASPFAACLLAAASFGSRAARLPFPPRSPCGSPRARPSHFLMPGFARVPHQGLLAPAREALRRLAMTQRAGLEMRRGAHTLDMCLPNETHK